MSLDPVDIPKWQLVTQKDLIPILNEIGDPLTFSMSAAVSSPEDETRPNVAEIGTTKTATLTLSLSKDPVSLSINQGIGSLSPTARSATKTGLTSSTAFTGTANNGFRDFTATASVEFQPRVYWGVSDSATLDAAAIQALSDSALAPNRVRSFTIDGGASPGKYLFYCYPAAFGDPSVYRIFGFDESYVKTTVSVTRLGVTANYTVLRSSGRVFGNAPMDIQ